MNLAVAAAAVVLATTTPQVGDLVTYRNPDTAGAICARVMAIAPGAGDTPTAWVMDVAYSPRVWRVPVAELEAGCTAAH